tara:strand:+ start:407 stop:634 length:228 start_codon:yes stop_codon:yes gene_type:complete
MASSKTKKKPEGMSSKDVRNLIHEIITFSNDKIQVATAQLMNEGAIDRAQAQKISAVLEATVKDAAFQVLAAKKL